MEDLIINIAIISPQLYPCITGGVEIFNYYLIKKLAEQGHKIWVFTLCNHDWKNKNVTNIKLRRRLLIFESLSITFHIILKLKKLRLQIDAIHVPYTSNNFIAYPMLLTKKLIGIPYIVLIHGGGMYPWFPKIPHKLFFQEADAIVAVSKTIKEEYEKRSLRKIIVIPPLIPFSKSKITKDELRKIYGFKDDDTIILYLGSIKKIKGSNILLNAFINLGKDYIESNNLKLLYIGAGAMKDKLERKIDEKSLNRYVKFFGNIPHERVPEMYELADMYIIPSLFEGNSLTLLEAMFNGLPIVGTNTTGINALIKNRKNGLLFEKGNIDDLKNNIRKIIDDTNLAYKLGNSAKNDYYKGYTFENVVSDHIKLFSEIIR